MDGRAAYPQQRLNDAWTLELAGHFHDIAAGTATPRAYHTPGTTTISRPTSSPAC